jgi:hypothetical protein
MWRRPPFERLNQEGPLVSRSSPGYPDIWTCTAGSGPTITAGIRRRAKPLRWGHDPSMVRLCPVRDRKCSGNLGFGETGQGVARGVWGAVVLGFLFLVAGVALALGSVSTRGRNRYQLPKVGARPSRSEARGPIGPSRRPEAGREPRIRCPGTTGTKSAAAAAVPRLAKRHIDIPHEADDEGCRDRYSHGMAVPRNRQTRPTGQDQEISPPAACRGTG